MALTKEELKWATVMALTTPPRGAPKPKPKAYLTFYSPDGEFTLRVYRKRKYWDGTLEYSIDTKNWITWDGTDISSSAFGYLYMRGAGNSVITGLFVSKDASWVFSSPVMCFGNIENLLDYSLVEAGVHPIMGTLCFAEMFGLGGITIAPELPATTLSFRCYDHMFYDCKNLTTAPKLPATVVAGYCYCYMFCGCTSLTSLPELPATTLESQCYYSMFRSCTSLRMSTVSDAEYLYSYRIPTSGTGIKASDALTYMFQNTGGPFTGTPTINTTYYTTNPPV